MISENDGISARYESRELIDNDALFYIKERFIRRRKERFC